MFNVTKFVQQVVHGNDQERHAQLSQFELFTLTKKEQSSLYKKVLSLKKVKEADSPDYSQILFLYALLTQFGIHRKRNSTQVNETLEKAIYLKNPYAMCLRAQLIEKINRQKAIELYDQAIALGCTWALYFKAKLYLQGTREEFEQAILLLDKGVIAKDPQALYARAILHKEANEFAAAIRLYDEAIALNHYEAMTQRANFYISGKESDVSVAKAIKLYERAMARGSVIAKTYRAILYLEKVGGAQNISKALKLFQQASAKNEPLAMVELAKLFLKGLVPNVLPPLNIQRAIDLLEKAIALGNSEAMIERGIIHLKDSGGPDQMKIAQELFEKAKILGNKRAFTYLALIFKDSKDPKEVQIAIEYLDQAIALKDSQAMTIRAVMYLSEIPAKEELAVKLLDEAIALENADAMVEQAKLYRDKKDTGKYIQFLDRACKLNHAKAMMLRADAYNDENKKEKAIELYERALLLGDKDVYKDALCNLGILYDNKGKKKEAIFYYDQAIEHGEHLAMAYRALYHLDDHQEAEAIALFEKAIQGKGSVELFEYGLYLFNKGNILKAIPLLEAAIALDNIKAMVVRARIHIKEKEYQKAFQLLDKAITLDSSEAKSLREELRSHQDIACRIALDEYDMARGVAEAFYSRGLKYQKGIGGPVDMQEACNCFTRAADKGHVASLTQLGQIHLEGIDGKTNPRVAAQFFDQALALGNPQAIRPRAALYKTGLAGKNDLVKYIVLRVVDYNWGGSIPLFKTHRLEDVTLLAILRGRLNDSQNVLTPAVLKNLAAALKFLNTLSARLNQPLIKNIYDVIQTKISIHYRVLEGFPESVKDFNAEDLDNLIYLLKQHALARYDVKGIQQVEYGLSYQNFATAEGVGTLKKLAKIHPEANYWLGMYYLNSPQLSHRLFRSNPKEQAMDCLKKASAANNLDQNTRQLAQLKLAELKGESVVASIATTTKEKVKSAPTPTLASTQTSSGKACSATATTKVQSPVSVTLEMFPSVPISGWVETHSRQVKEFRSPILNT
ncbi:MAG: sel1 repeat family protein [Legionella sp.]|nr:MAG: sel1 repeat family protein [Legionella sp.]